MDFSAKIKSANTLQDALKIGDRNKTVVRDDEDKATSNSAGGHLQTFRDVLASAYAEMREYGFSSLDEYYEYLNSGQADDYADDEGLYDNYETADEGDSCM